MRHPAAQARILLPRRSRRGPPPRKAPRTPHEAATAWFEEQLRRLPSGAAGARVPRPAAASSHRGIRRIPSIGYAPGRLPRAWRERLGSPGRSPTPSAPPACSAQKEHEDAGTHGPLYDRFRRRVTCSRSANEGGRVIAFTARTLETGEKAGPKYINSPETPLYSKGHVLFNLDKAKSVIRQAGFALLVEGQMDCISVFLRGIQNVIATSGTAFTEQQVAILKRHTSNVVVNFDPDAAGSNAAEKSIALLTQEGFSIRIVTLDGGLDPDRYVRERGVDAYSQAVRGARPRPTTLSRGRGRCFPAPARSKK